MPTLIAEVRDREATAATVLNIPFRPFRHVVFPNNIRALRRARPDLSHDDVLSPRADAVLGGEPRRRYLRLSKIERGEVVPTAEELTEISRALALDAERLMVDVTSPSFSLADWGNATRVERMFTPQDDRLALLVAAGFRRARRLLPSRSTAQLRALGLRGVDMWRIENACRPINRWKPRALEIIAAVLGLEAADVRNISFHVEELHAAGELSEWLSPLIDESLQLDRIVRTVARIRAELDGVAGSVAALPRRQDPLLFDSQPPPAPALRPILLRGDGSTASGLIAHSRGGATVIAPGPCGPGAFALRTGRPVLGPAFPAGTILVVDPDRPPSVGGVAVILEDEGFRVVALSTDRTGARIGYTVTPPAEYDVEGLDYGRLLGVTLAQLP